MAGYSGTPLVKKIGIKPADRVLFSGPPKGFEKKMQPWPEGVKLFLVPGAGKDFNVVMFFTDKRASLEKELPKLRYGRG